MGRRARGQLPQMRHHKRSGTARVRVDGREIQLGRWGSPQAQQRYFKIIADLIRRQDLGVDVAPPPVDLDPSEPSGHPVGLEPATFTPADGDGHHQSPAQGITIAQMCAAYLADVDKKYVQPDGRPTSTVGNVKMALRALGPYGNFPAAGFGPRLLRKVQEDLVQQEGRRKGPDGRRLPKFRKTINRTISGICRVFKWAVSMELVAAPVYQALVTVEPLRKQRTTAPELPEVEAVPDADIEKTLPHLPEIVADMVRVHRLLGCRPSEICALRPSDVDRSRDIWAYRPQKHKNEWREQKRRISIGPKAQAILARYLDRPPTRPCFVPAESEAKRNAMRRKGRQSPMTPSHRERRRNRRRKFDPDKPYTDDTYRRAIHRACKKAGVQVWSPNQLRHAAAEEAREKLSLDAAQARLGHKHAKVTEVYAKRQEDRADDVARMLG
jgi:integrase